MAIEEGNVLIQFRLLGDSASVSAARKRLSGLLMRDPHSHNWESQSRTENGVREDTEVSSVSESSVKELMTSVLDAVGSQVFIEASLPSMKGISVVPRQTRLG